MLFIWNNWFRKVEKFLSNLLFLRTQFSAGVYNIKNVVDRVMASRDSEPIFWVFKKISAFLHTLAYNFPPFLYSVSSRVTLCSFRKFFNKNYEQIFIILIVWFHSCTAQLSLRATIDSILSLPAPVQRMSSSSISSNFGSGYSFSFTCVPPIKFCILTAAPCFFPVPPFPGIKAPFCGFFTGAVVLLCCFSIISLSA